MLDTWNRAEHYRDLAEECRRLATSTLSRQMKKRYLLMAKDYILLADVEEQAHTSCTEPRLQKMPSTSESPT
jgi:hypothetical protein